MSELIDETQLAAVSARLDLREPNREAIETLAIRIASHFALEHRDPPFEGVIDAATGVGKTFILAGAIDYFAAEGHRNFAVIAPGRTIMEKTARQFTAGDSKSLLDGMETDPVLITSDNFNTAAMRAAMDDPQQVKLYVFTVQALTNPKSIKAGGRKTHKFQEGLGAAFYDHLDAKDDLIVFADEHHCYYGPGFSSAVRDLTPYALVGLTATPHKKTPEDQIIFRYPLAAAIADRHVKTPVLVGRKDDRSDPLTKVLDGIKLLEAKRAAVERYCAANPSVRPVNPVMMLVAPTIEEAEQLAEQIRSPQFLAGRYADNVLVVHSKKADEDLAKLDAVEDDDSPVRIIISVGMLKEGWDVKNVYVIASLRASVSEVLTEQTLGRGLRLPFGRYTGVEMLDTLEVIAHERYEDLLKKAKVLNEGFIDYRTYAITHTGEDGETVVTTKSEEVGAELVPEAAADAAAVEEAVEGVDHGAGLTLVAMSDRTGQAEAELSAPTLKPKGVVPPLLLPHLELSRVENPWSLADITDHKPFRRLGEELASSPDEELRRMKLSAEVRTGPDGLKRTVLSQQAAADQIAGSTVLKPLENVRHELIEAAWNSGVVPQRKVEAQALGQLADKLIDGLGENADRLLSSYGQRVAGRFVQLIGEEQTRYASKTSYDEKVTLKRFAPERTGRAETNSDRFTAFKRNVGYTGWTRSMYEQEWFDSSTERDLAARILDDEATINYWVRLQTGDLTIAYEGGNYNPDFVVAEKAGDHWLIEVKADKDMKDPTVLAKQEAAQRWANRVSLAEDVDAQWRYLLVSETDIKNAKGSWAALKAPAATNG